jgi:hypothetical protein
MRSRRLAPLACALLLAPFCLAQTKLDATDLERHPFSADFGAGGKLKLKVRSGEVRVVGTEENRISVELSGRRADEARDLRVRFESKDGRAQMRISGGPKNELTITVRIPSKTDLYARIPFGEVSVSNVIGNQDIEIHAGDLTVEVGTPADYARVDASVFTGELDAPAFGEDHGGLFRSVKKTGAGQYRIHAHVGAGQLTLQ